MPCRFELAQPEAMRCRKKRSDALSVGNLGNVSQVLAVGSLLGDNALNILLIGGAGYIGSACLRGLLAKGHNPYAYDDLSLGNRQSIPADRLIMGDIFDSAFLIKTMRDYAIEAVMHFAALASVPQSIADPDSYYHLNVIGTKSVLDALHVAGVKRFLFSSTCATYDHDAPMPLHESSLQIPRSPYGSTKLTAEAMIRDYGRAYGLGYAILRYFNAAGADSTGLHGECRRNEFHLIPLIFQNILGQRDKILVHGTGFNSKDGTCVRDYVHIEDLFRAHCMVIERLRPGSSMIYNVGSGTGSTVLEVIRACEDVSGCSVAMEPADPRPGDPGVLVASSDKIARELGYQPVYGSIHSVVETAWMWHESHPFGYAA